MADKSLFTFEWPVDKAGYDLELVKPRRSPGRTPTQLTAGDTEPYYVIRRRGGPLSYYRPLEDHPGLARRLADLATTAASDDTALRDFANEFGLLGVWAGLGFDPEKDREERIDDWRSFARSLRYVFWLKDGGNLETACTEFNEHVRPRFTARIYYERAKRPELEIVPATLAGALWFQVAGELTYGTKFKRCDWCPTWFPVGRGTGRRETRKFCSDRCRMAWHRHHKEKAK